MNQEETKKYVESLLRTKSWKSSAITGMVCLIVLVLLNSFLFTLILMVLKMVLFIVGIGLLIYAAWQGYPLLVDRYK